ncbi:DUF1697 domain-containing protein [Streptomyces armeniacus]|uniref:DUF1697 domain-containing protein n=1 Tax=Streptomyces armeniacus TaxID=83291 RepID=A0A345XMH2_9ACTN|nr:DUF1697 domain-containing protein [Streptomyces armeniacus]AXK32838.1 DUF1697 domain-containing protein [Streptomyces armeniacus]
MTTYAALLRGINVGGHKKIPMAELRELMKGLGWTDVRTYLQSGNAVFTTPDEDPDQVSGAGSGPDSGTGTGEGGAEETPRTRLERAIAGHFGFEVPCLVRTHTELREIADACPYPAAELDPAKLLVLFLDETPDPGHFASLDPEAYAPDTFRHIGRAVYCYFPDGMGSSKLPDALGTVRPQLTSTGRNWRTVTKLIELTA